MKLPTDKLNAFFGCSLLIILIVFVIITLYIIIHKGKGPISDKVVFCISMVITPMLCLPLWIDPNTTYLEKAIISILAVTGAYIYYVAGDRIIIFIRHIMANILKR